MHFAWKYEKSLDLESVSLNLYYIYKMLEIVSTLNDYFGKYFEKDCHSCNSLGSTHH